MNEGILHLTQGTKDQFSTSTTTALKTGRVQDES